MFPQLTRWDWEGQKGIGFCGRGGGRRGKQVETEPWLLGEATSALSGTTWSHHKKLRA